MASNSDSLAVIFNIFFNTETVPRLQNAYKGPIRELEVYPGTGIFVQVSHPMPEMELVLENDFKERVKKWTESVIQRMHARQYKELNMLKDKHVKESTDCHTLLNAQIRQQFTEAKHRASKIMFRENPRSKALEIVTDDEDEALIMTDEERPITDDLRKDISG